MTLSRKNMPKHNTSTSPLRLLMNAKPAPVGYFSHPIFNCPHLANFGDSICETTNGAEISKMMASFSCLVPPIYGEYDPKKVSTQCVLCETYENIQLCLQCGVASCGNQGNGHSEKHYGKTGSKHCLAMSTADLTVWCYECNTYVQPSKKRPVSKHLGVLLDLAHLNKFGTHNPSMVALGWTVPGATVPPPVKDSTSQISADLDAELSSTSTSSKTIDTKLDELAAMVASTTISSPRSSPGKSQKSQAAPLIADPITVPNNRRFKPKANVVTAVFYHPFMMNHDMGPMHPEQPQRLLAIANSIEKFFHVSMSDCSTNLKAYIAAAQKAKSTGGVIPLESSEIDEQYLLLAHSASHIKFLKESFPKEKNVSFRIDMDTSANWATWRSALLSVGALTTAVDLICVDDIPILNAFCVGRPPGHHAEPDSRPDSDTLLPGEFFPSPSCGAMGFCFFSNVAIAAKYALTKPNISRVAIFDYDVHHGNGTQKVAENDHNILYISTHQHPHYPGTGTSSLEPNIVNIPMAAGTNGHQYRQLVLNTVMPAIEQFKPDLILLSTGFDAHKRDPLSSIRLDDADYYWTASLICKAAARLCNSRVISALEGGYSLTALSDAGKMHVWALTQADLPL